MSTMFRREHQSKVLPKQLLYSLAMAYCIVQIYLTEAFCLLSFLYVYKFWQTFHSHLGIFLSCWNITKSITV